jgi:hypothetical protein
MTTTSLRIVLVGRSLVPQGVGFKHEHFTASSGFLVAIGGRIGHTFKVEYPTQIELIVALGGCRFETIHCSSMRLYPSPQGPTFDCEYPTELVAGFSHILLGNGFVLEPAFELTIEVKALESKHGQDDPPKTKRSVPPTQGSSQGTGDHAEGTGARKRNPRLRSSKGQSNPGADEDPLSPLSTTALEVVLDPGKGRKGE